MFHETLPAPIGMDASSDPVLMAPGSAQWLQNFLVDGPGRVRGVGFTPLSLPFLPNPVDGLAWHFGVGGEQDKLLVLSGGALYAARPLDVADDALPAFTDWNLIGGGFPVGKALRSAQYGTETILVLEDGSIPVRYDGANLYRLGIERPPAPVVSVNPPTVPPGNKAGVITYKQSYADARLRESSLSDGTTIDFGAVPNVGKAAFIPSHFGADPQVKYVYTYANLNGGAVWYRVGTADVDGAIIEDNFPDNVVSTKIVGPKPGQNDPPLKASCVAVHKNRVWMNSTEQPATLQISNAASVTQWAAVNTSDADGLRLSVTTDQADGISALVSFGSLLAVYKRQRIYQVFGDAPSQYRIVEIHQRGTTAPNSVARCDNVICTLLDAAVYAASYNDGFLLTKISDALDAIFEPMQDTRGGRSLLEHAQGSFSNNRYFLQVGAGVYCFDFDTKEWSIFGDAAPLGK